ncbi:MAG: hypothetical protein K1X66_02425 [Verrucomicrobiae bacterium]|nr:hypothetical protein [Verrucomicrobiae bacterium]
MNGFGRILGFRKTASPKLLVLASYAFSGSLLSGDNNLIFPDEDLDVNGNFDSVLGVFTSTKDAYYNFSSRLTFQSAAVGDQEVLKLIHQGTTIFDYAEELAEGAYTYSLTIDRTLRVGVGGRVNLVFTHTSAIGAPTLIVGKQYSWLEITQIPIP